MPLVFLDSKIVAESVLFTLFAALRARALLSSVPWAIMPYQPKFILMSLLWLSAHNVFTYLATFKSLRLSFHVIILVWWRRGGWPDVPPVDLKHATSDIASPGLLLLLFMALEFFAGCQLFKLFPRVLHLLHLIGFGGEAFSVAACLCLGGHDSIFVQSFDATVGDDTCLV